MNDNLKTALFGQFWGLMTGVIIVYLATHFPNYKYSDVVTFILPALILSYGFLWVLKNTIFKKFYEDMKNEKNSTKKIS